MPVGDGWAAGRFVVFAASSQRRVAVQGFTLRNGFADAGEDNTTRNQGGLVWCGGGTGAHQVLDGELVGGDAYRGGIAMRGDFLRCIFRDTVARSGSGTRGASICNYVNAATGSDANDGFTAATPWKTLAQIANSGLMLPGDCVHAAAGDYAEGTVAGLADGVGNCRVLMPTGVTLVADEGAETTRIVGAADKSVSDSYGRGPNAVRCAYLQAGARLIGFTLTGGRVPNAEGGDVAGTPSCVGGGLYSEELASVYLASATGGALLAQASGGAGLLFVVR